MSKLTDGQRHEYLPYERGLLPAAVRIGNLYLDPLNPISGCAKTRFRFQGSLDQEQYETKIQEYCWNVENDNKNISIAFRQSREGSFSALIAAAHGESTSDSHVTASLVGQSGRRLQLEDPERLLEECVLKQDGVKDWLERQAKHGFFAKHCPHPYNVPNVWMVSGVQLVTNGDVEVKSSRSNGASFGGKADLSAAVSAPTGTLPVGGDVTLQHNSEAEHKWDHEDERVWAVQYMKLTFKYGRDALHSGTKVLEEFKLEAPVDLRSRGFREGTPTAEIPEPVGVLESFPVQKESGMGPIVLDEIPYISAMMDVDWYWYNETSTYLDGL